MIPVFISRFMTAVEFRMQASNTINVEKIAAALLAENPAYDTLGLDNNDGPYGEVQERIFHVLISSPQLVGIVIPSDVDMTWIEGLLRKVIPVMPNLRHIAISNGMTPTEAERILPILRRSPTLAHLAIFLGDNTTTTGIAEPLARYLGESLLSLKGIGLAWSRCEASHEPVSGVADGAATMICNGIGASTSLTSIIVSPPPPEDTNSAAAKSIAQAVAHSASLRAVKITNIGPSSRAFMNQICHALKCTDPVRNFDLCFRQSETDTLIVLKLNKSAPWKPLLSQEVPLNYWPRILAKTNTWNQETSHSPLDALYLLIKEKNDVLLQNVHRRRIRKRKRVS